MAKVLVTGASGFIGSHLVELLVQEGHTVRAMINPAGNQDGNLGTLGPEVQAHVERYPADLRDTEAVNLALAGIETVFHLGAIISVPYSHQDPETTLLVNTIGTLNVLKGMQKQGTGHGVIASTSEVYGSAQYVPVDEKHPLRAQSPYAASKIAAEAITTSFYHSAKLPVVIVRPFNTFGPRQSIRAVIPTIISQALTKPVISLGAIHVFRDYTYVRDTACGLMMAGLSEKRSSVLGKIINLGTGRSITIREIAQKIVDLLGCSATISSNEPIRLRPEGSEILQVASNHDLATALLSWQPQTSLEEGLQQTIDWMRSHVNDVPL